MIQNIIEKWNLKSRRIFMADGLGALLTALTLGIVFPLFNDSLGVPDFVLFCLFSMASTFAIYSWSCYFLNLKYMRPLLAIIIAGNSTYCLFTVFVLYFLWPNLSAASVSYFVFEVIVILLLVIAEIKILSQMRIKQHQKEP